MPFASRGRVSLGHALGIVLAFNLLLGMAPTLHAAVDAQEDELLGMCRVDSLPQDIRGSLSRNFSAWKIQEPTDLSVRARTRWGEERPLSCPGIAAGHFQDPKAASYALMLIPANHSSGAYKVLVYTQQAGQQFYGFKAVGQAENGASDVFVTAVQTTRFPDATSKWVAHSKITEVVMMVDSAATQAFLYVWGDMTYNREQVTYQ
jgi:hypothetical protein